MFKHSFLLFLSLYLLSTPTRTVRSQQCFPSTSTQGGGTTTNTGSNGVVTVLVPADSTVSVFVGTTCPANGQQTITSYSNIPATQAPYTSTFAGQGSDPATVVIGQPTSAGIVTTTTILSAGATPYTSTTGNTVYVGIPTAGTTTRTTTLAAGATGYTSTFSGGGTTSGTVVVGTPKAAPVTTITTTIAAAQFTNGLCVNDSSAGRALLQEVYLEPTYNNQTNTPSQCSDFCAGLGYTYSGTEYTYQCFCGNSIYQYYSGDVKFSGFPVTPTTVQDNVKNTFCNRTCPADKTKLCGGFGGLELYSALPSASQNF